MRTLARHIALNERHRVRRRQALEGEYEEDIRGATQPLLDQLTRLLDGETMRHTRDCVDRLSETARRVLQSYYFDGVPTKQIAHQESKTEPWVHLTLFRARGAVGRCLEQKGVLSCG